MESESPIATFGTRLRELRIRAGLSQAEIGGGSYTASYVSHLESGRRQPTEEAVTFFASRLGIPVDELTDVDRHAYAPGSVTLSVMEADSALWDAQRIGDPALVLERAEAVMATAIAARRADLWWQAQRCRLQALTKLGQFGDACVIGEELANHSITLGSPDLTCDVLGQLARAHRAYGQLAQALTVVDRAVQAGRDGGVPASTLVRALIVQVATLTDIGRLADVDGPAGWLTELRDHIDSSQELGQICWVLGNVAFLHGDVAGGVAEHDRALTLFRPEVDLAIWARFRQASARLRLEAGLSEGVDELIDAAALALSLVGGPGDLGNLETVRALHALELGKPNETILLCDGVLDENSVLSPQSRADVRYLRHRALLALGDVGAAREDLRLAAEWYEQAGAWQRAVGMWRLRADLEDGVGTWAATSLEVAANATDAP